MVALLEGPGGNLRKELYPESGWEAIETGVIAWFFTMYDEIGVVKHTSAWG